MPPRVWELPEGVLRGAIACTDDALWTAAKTFRRDFRALARHHGASWATRIRQEAKGRKDLSDEEAWAIVLFLELIQGLDSALTGKKLRAAVQEAAYKAIERGFRAEWVTTSEDGSRRSPIPYDVRGGEGSGPTNRADLDLPGGEGDDLTDEEILGQRGAYSLDSYSDTSEEESPFRAYIVAVHELDAILARNPLPPVRGRPQRPSGPGAPESVSLTLGLGPFDWGDPSGVRLPPSGAWKRPRHDTSYSRGGPHAPFEDGGGGEEREIPTDIKEAEKQVQRALAKVRNRLVQDHRARLKPGTIAILCRLINTRPR